MSDPSLVDAEQRALASDPTLNIALEASAGTGKTRVLVDRYVRLIEEGASPRHVLAITFTRKAAGEMRSRIIDELRTRDALWSELRGRLFEIHIATIDAFCLGLLREFPLEAGLEPDIVLIDEVDSRRLLEVAIDQVLGAGRRHRGIDLRFLLTRFGEGPLRRGIREFVTSRLLKSELLGRYVKRMVPAGLDLESSTRRFANAMSAAFRGHRGVDRFADGVPSDLGGIAFALRRAVDPETVGPADIEALAGYFLTKAGAARKRLPRACRPELFANRSDYDAHRDQTLALAPIVAGAYRAWLREKDFYAIRELEAFYRVAARRFDDLKKARAGLDFTDVLVQAVALLERRGEFSQSRFRLESRYHHLLIDEFQDTNEVQWRLVRALVDSWGEGHGLVQEAILSEQAAGTGTGRLAEPTLFIVGDRKQSIYGWRDARVEIMDDVSRQLLGIRPGGGRRLSLTTSFRASGDLLSFLNAFFDEIPKARRDLEWSFQYRERDHFPVGVVDEASRPVAIAVARDLADVAAAVADETVRVLTEEGRRPKDVAILFRSRSSYRAYERALSERGVPTYVYRGLGFFDSPEVRDIAALVRYLAEPTSELRSAELARSRWIGLSDDALVRIATGRERPLARWLEGSSPDAEPTLHAADVERVRLAASRVPKWVSRVDRVPAGELVERILTETDYAAWFRDDEQSWENLKKVLSMIRRAQNRGYLTLSRLAEYLDNASTDDESPAVLEAVDAVNLMTVHAAKGLEFDTVFLVNLHKHTRRDSSLPRIRELPDGRVEVSALSSSPAEAAAENRADEEEKRLLYVAMTRARRNLCLSSVLGTGGDVEASFQRLLPDSMKQAFEAALDSDADEVEWSRHRLRVLRARTDHHYEHERPDNDYRLDLEPLSARERVEPNVEPREPGEVLETEDRHRVDRVPFSILSDGRVRRGVMDVAVSRERVTVVRLAPRSLDASSTARIAAEALFPDRDVEVKLGRTR